MFIKRGRENLREKLQNSMGVILIFSCGDKEKNPTKPNKKTTKNPKKLTKTLNPNPKINMKRNRSKKQNRTSAVER